MNPYQIFFIKLLVSLSQTVSLAVSSLHTPPPTPPFTPVKFAWLLGVCKGIPAQVIWPLVNIGFLLAGSF